MFKYFTQERIQVVEGYALHTDFAEDNKKLRPVFFSHGLVFNRTGYSGICRELASHGCIVYAFDHTDGSCSYFSDTTQDPPKDVYYTDYDPKKDEGTAEEYRKKQIANRLKDVDALFKYVNEMEVTAMPCIDIHNLSYVGHSYGGMTALEACHATPDNFKYCVAIDPVFKPRWQQIEENSDFACKVPFMMISNEYFQSEKVRSRDNYDQWKAVCKFYEDSLKVQNDPDGKKNYNIVLPGSYHLVQFDWALRDGYMLKLFRQIGFFCNVEKKQKQTCQYILQMLDLEEGEGIRS